MAAERRWYEIRESHRSERRKKNSSRRIRYWMILSVGTNLSSPHLIQERKKTGTIIKCGQFAHGTDWVRWVGMKATRSEQVCRQFSNSANVGVRTQIKEFIVAGLFLIFGNKRPYCDGVRDGQGGCELQVAWVVKTWSVKCTAPCTGFGTRISTQHGDRMTRTRGVSRFVASI